MSLEIQLAVSAVFGIIWVIMLDFGVLFSKVQPDLFNIHVVFHLLDVFSEIENFGLGFLQLCPLCFRLVGPTRPAPRSSLSVATRTV